MSAALVALAAPGLLGNERATLILTDGSRRSGEIVSRPVDENVPSNNLTLLENGREETISTSQIAVIDFAGGRPQGGEMNQVPPGGNFIVLRNGVSGPGTYVNIAAGTTVVWRAQAGGDQRYAIRDVSRIYLNAQGGRTGFGGRRGNNGGAAERPRTIQVSATQAWTDTGMDVQQGERITITATGDITFSPGRTSNAGGNPAVTNPQFPVGNWPVGALIGRVGATKPFGVGAAQSILMPAAGRLMLGVNDTILTDNSGAFQVTISRTP
jgi:hypothetical protein